MTIHENPPRSNATQTKVERLAKRIRSATQGTSLSVKISATLHGPSAATWKALQEAMGNLALDDASIMGLLMEAGASTVRQALKAAQSE